MIGWAQVVGVVAAAIVAASPVFAQMTPAEPFAPGAAAPAEAGSMPPSGKPRPAEARVTRAAAHADRGGSFNVAVNNKRSVGLVDLTIGPAGEPGKKVAGPLAFGRRISVRVQRTPDCKYDVRGHFADEADFEQLGVDLCKDKIINLTDE